MSDWLTVLCESLSLGTQCTHELVVSLRAFVREALGLDPIPTDGIIPMQGPTRPGGAG